MGTCGIIKRSHGGFENFLRNDILRFNGLYVFQVYVAVGRVFDDHFRGLLLGGGGQERGVPPLPARLLEHVVKDAENPRAVLLLLASEIENRVVEISNKHGTVQSASKGVPIVGTVNILVQREVLQGKALHLLQDFWRVRNRVAHSVDASLTDTELYGLVEVGIRILRLLYQEDEPYAVEPDYR